MREQFATFRTLSRPGEFEPVLFNAAALGLDRRFVHRLRMVTRTACTPLNERELVADALMNHGGVLRARA